jgi:uracil-DNA glycosylase
VASEPYIFWRGENAETLIRQIVVPEELGRLVPASQQFNGPSGIALDDLILKPLGLTREDAWLCDLVPHSCVNASQRKAIERAYLPLVEKYQLPVPSVPLVPTRLTDEQRRMEILKEIKESGADTLVLLGDKPIQWFLKYLNPHWKRLSDFTQDGQNYGILHEAAIDGSPMKILPLAHPRQIARLGRSSPKWYRVHQDWLVNQAGRLFN